MLNCFFSGHMGFIMYHKGDIAYRIRTVCLKWRSAFGVLCGTDFKGHFYWTSLGPIVLMGRMWSS